MHENQLKPARPAVLYVMPVFNADRWLQSSLDSLLNQKYAPLQILCVDDGSSDASMQILMEYADRDSRVQVLKQNHGGPGVAFNKGVRFADDNGFPYIARMDADDISLPDRTPKQVEALEGDPSLAACGCSASYFIHSGKTVGHSRVPIAPAEIRAEILAGGRGLIQGATIFRTQFIRDLGGYRPEKTPAEDTDLFLRLTAANPVINLPDELYRIRIHQESHSLKDLHQTRLYHHYYLHLGRLRSSDQPEVELKVYADGLSTLQKIKIRKEEIVMWAYFRWMTQRSLSCLVLAALLDVGRTMRRIRKFFLRMRGLYG